MMVTYKKISLERKLSVEKSHPAQKIGTGKNPFSVGLARPENSKKAPEAADQAVSVYPASSTPCSDLLCAVFSPIQLEYPDQPRAEYASDAQFNLDE